MGLSANELLRTLGEFANERKLKLTIGY